MLCKWLNRADLPRAKSKRGNKKDDVSWGRDMQANVKIEHSCKKKSSISNPAEELFTNLRIGFVLDEIANEFLDMNGRREWEERALE